MGHDKAFLLWENMPLYKRAFNQLQPFCGQIYLSCRSEQQRHFQGATCLVDLFPDTGPMGAILTAFEFFPEVSWIVLAVDLPLISAETIGKLLVNQNTSSDVTLFETADGTLQPLCAIYRPGIRKQLERMRTIGMFSLKEAIIHSNSQIIDWEGDPECFTNVNTPQSWEAFKQRYGQE